MRFGFVVPFGDADQFARAAVSAEAAGWDAVFTWEAVWGVDAWVSLTAAAERTTRIRLGTMLTPLPRVRPWDLASRVATLDRLSGGRVQLAVGLGAVHEGWTAFEPDQGRRRRVELLDEGLAVYDGLMRGQPFSFDGEHYRVRPTDFMVPPPPVQRPRVPVWVVGGYVEGRGSQPSLDRAARWDGLLPQLVGGGAGLRPDQLVEVLAHVRRAREQAGLPWGGYDVVVEGTSYGPQASTPAVWVAAGATWWVEGAWDLAPDVAGQAELARRITAGPPPAGTGAQSQE